MTVAAPASFPAKFGFSYYALKRSPRFLNKDYELGQKFDFFSFETKLTHILKNFVPTQTIFKKQRSKRSLI